MSALYCCAYGCKNNKLRGTPVRFLRFPKNQLQRSLWVAAVLQNATVNADWKLPDNPRLCLEHFESDAFENNTGASSKFAKLKSDAVPSIFEISEQTECTQNSFEPEQQSELHDKLQANIEEPLEVSKSETFTEEDEWQCVEPCETFVSDTMEPEKGDSGVSEGEMEAEDDSPKERNIISFKETVLNLPSLEKEKKLCYVYKWPETPQEKMVANLRGKVRKLKIRIRKLKRLIQKEKEKREHRGKHIEKFLNGLNE